MQARDGIIVAAEFATVDPYRATTHNKGIMNGIDPVAIATGNDWRAIEAGAHAYAARGGRYSSLTDWWADEAGNLCGRIELPIKVGIVGAPIESNPTVALNLRLLGVKSATELAQVMAAVGLAQNFAAIRALATEGIQKGHMTLHARSVVTAAGAPKEIYDEVLDRLVQSGVIKVWKAQELVTEVQDERQKAAAGPKPKRSKEAAMGVGYGKVILLGEHAVVYGRARHRGTDPAQDQSARRRLRRRDSPVDSALGRRVPAREQSERATLVRAPGRRIARSPRTRASAR